MKKPEINVSADELVERIKSLAARLSEAVDLAEKAGLNVRVETRDDFRAAMAGNTEQLLTVTITKKYTY